MMPDTELLTRYANRRDEAAFTELVRRHLDHVYSTALRLVGRDTQLAEDVTQAVFTDLSRKAGSLRDCQALSGWLHTSARFAAAKVVRAEQRRRQRERITLTMPPTPSASVPDWEQVRSFLDETIAELGDTERDALLLRYFEKKPFAEVGAALGLSENAARMRVERALDRLRWHLAAKGITSTTLALGTAMAEHVVGVAPSALGARIISQASAASAGHASWLGSLTGAGKLAVATGVLLTVSTVGVMLKRSIATPVPASDAFGKDANTATHPGSSSSLSNGSEASAAKTGAQPRGGLELLFVDDNTGLPITNGVIALRGWERGSQLLVEKKVELEAGRCLAPFDPTVGPGYWILTRVDAYADTRLRWNPRRGEVIPDFYTVRLVRPGLIHGRVVDPAGNPLADAEVAFGHNDIPGNDASPEDHGIDHLIARTDAEGRWQIDRIAPDLLPYLEGSATHSNYVKTYVSVSAQLQSARELLDGTFVFRLGEAAEVGGRVVNLSGEPVAHAIVRVGHLDESRSREGHTQADGTFRVAGCEPGEQLVTAHADGFAPAVILLKLEANAPPVSLTLGPGKTLRIRVVDQYGQPISGATAWYNIFADRLRGPFPQVDFNRRADTEGRIVWEHAPDQDLEFHFQATGYMQAEDIVLRPEDQEQVVTLSPALVVAGTVRDAGTGDLLPRFRLRIGWPQAGEDDSAQPWWSTIDRFSPSFAGGEFRHSLEEAVVSGTSNRGYIFQFEAEGYAPHRTRVYRPDEGEVRLDIRLQRAGALPQ